MLLKVNDIKYLNELTRNTINPYQELLYLKLILLIIQDFNFLKNHFPLISLTNFSLFIYLILKFLSI